MKTEITSKEYRNIYEVCDWNSKAVSIVLKRLGYSDELIVNDSLNLYESPIKSLVNVKEVGGFLYLRHSQIQSLGNLKHVGSWLDLRHSPIQDLGILEKVGGDLDLIGTPVSKKYSKKGIIQMVKVGGNIWLG